MGFKQGFVWGVATASYQIEGGVDDGGRGPSVWDMFCRKPGTIFNGDSGDVTCDHYHRYAEDIALMRELGVQASRMSIAWPRVQPWDFAVNPEGLAFYDRVVDAYLEAGIAPWVTLYHWDTPVWLYRRGHWLNPDMPRWFAEYSEIVVRKLGDRVKHWMTLNEPQVFIGLGIESGRHAPGDRLARSEVLQAWHHTLLAHGLSVQAIRAASPGPAQVGMAPVGGSLLPATDSPEDIEAARTAAFSSNASVWDNTMWMDPTLKGHYPEDALAAMGADTPHIKPGDMETICQPVDFLGLNMYQAQYYRAAEDGGIERVREPAGRPRTAFHWPITPELMYWMPKFFYERYQVPLAVTENGLSNTDWVGVDGKVRDPQRIDFLTRYLREYRRAADEGVDCLGYFQWSFMDNFEWGEGFRERFGLVHVDYQTLVRTPKESFAWYRDVIRTNGTTL